MNYWLAATQTVFQALMGIAAVWGAYIAWRGLDTWRHQIDSAVGRRVLVTTYRLRNLVRDARQAGRPATFDDANSQLQDWLARVNDATSDLEAAALEADAAWDEPISPAIARFNGYTLVVGKALAFRVFGHDDNPLRTPDGDEFPANVIANKPLEGDPDPFGDCLLNAVTAIKEAVEHRMNRKHGVM